MASNPPRRRTVIVRVVALTTIISAILLGVAVGLSLAETVNVINQENYTVITPALPTKLLDINGKLITEYSTEKRELVSVDELPLHLINAVIAREDHNFYSHKGFDLKGIIRAFYGRIIGVNLGGGSTITQQVAGTLYANRQEITYWRKLRELWWSFQLERRYTKNEILEIYLNQMYMGAGTFGVEAASKYFFGHSAREITLAESAILVIQLSSPAKYNPLDNPNVAKERQWRVLEQMIAMGYTTLEEAKSSFDDYWLNYDYTRVSAPAYFSRDDKARWFSEHVRIELENILYGSLNYFTDGFVVNTTLDLDFQAVADTSLQTGIINADEAYKKTQNARLEQAESLYTPIVDLLALTFDLSGIHVSEERTKERALSRYTKRINPIIDAMSLVFGLNDLKVATNSAFADLKKLAEKNTVEGALITIENNTGYIKALAGGSPYSTANQSNIAINGYIMPGSAFKPLYYSAAIDSKKFTMASLIYDSPVVFHNENGTPYIPLNFKGEWKGPVLLWYALAHSMNVPSLKVLDGIGFDAAIDRAALLLGVEDEAAKRAMFPRYYPLGLGVLGLAPVQLARAYAVFGNQGREVTPIAIRSVQDRNGKIIADPEKELRLLQQKKGKDIQVISPQNAYVMTSLLQKTVESGTLANPSGWGAKFTFYDEEGNKYKMPAAGKTGTTDNWGDAWAVGLTPYYTTAVWLGFKLPGNSLGVDQTGSTIAGPVWAGYMNQIHQGLPRKDFIKPADGLIEVTVCAKTGLLPTDACDEGTVDLVFLEGTQPTAYCDLHESAGEQLARSLNLMRVDSMLTALPLVNIQLPTLPLGFGQDGQSESQDSSEYSDDGQSDYNPLLD